MLAIIVIIIPQGRQDGVREERSSFHLELARGSWGAQEGKDKGQGPSSREPRGGGRAENGPGEGAPRGSSLHPLLLQPHLLGDAPCPPCPLVVALALRLGQCLGSACGVRWEQVLHGFLGL